jgi:hypothetical protein
LEPVKHSLHLPVPQGRLCNANYLHTLSKPQYNLHIEISISVLPRFEFVFIPHCFRSVAEAADKLNGFPLGPSALIVLVRADVYRFVFRFK